MIDISVDISVAICTYNGEHRLPLVIDRLRSQLNIENLRWEIIIVDNNSTDGTADWVHQLQAQPEPNLPNIHYVTETQQGLAFARQRAIETAQGRWVAFLDDDNLPHEQWLTVLVQFAQEHPQAGAFHGKILGNYEIQPPKNFDRIAAFWAIGGGSKVRCYTQDPKAARKRLLPPGAGIVVQRQAWLGSVPTQLNQVGRLGQSLVGAEDIEAMLHLRNAGWEIWYTPEMCIDHLISKNRLTPEYAVRLMHDIGLGRWQTRRLGFERWQRPMALVGFWCNDLRKAIVHFIHYRHQFQSDCVAVAEMEFFRGCLLSPFYSAKSPK
jgi:glycosyltransferase involved in cell wall biosynthesis